MFERVFLHIQRACRQGVSGGGEKERTPTKQQFRRQRSMKEFLHGGEGDEKDEDEAAENVEEGCEGNEMTSVIT